MRKLSHLRALNEARKVKDYKTSDAIRALLGKVEIMPEGSAVHLEYDTDRWALKKMIARYPGKAIMFVSFFAGTEPPDDQVIYFMPVNWDGGHQYLVPKHLGHLLSDKSPVSL